jgi:hypothetical protein
MNTNSTPSDSTRDLHALAALATLASRQLEEPWFDEPAPSSRRSSAPPSSAVRVGEFLGDPLADAWLR